MTFLFDIGKVLLDFDFDAALTTLLPATHPDPLGALSQLMAKKDDFEAGLISVGNYTNWALEIMESTATPEQFHTAWRSIFTPNLPMWEEVRNLAAQGHRLILFSNTNAIHCPQVFEDFPEFSLFHGSILSFEVNSIKPHPEIYQHAIAKYSLVPENTLYIDDLLANIQTGIFFGFRTHQYDLANHAAFKVWLTSELASHTPPRA